MICLFDHIDSTQDEVKRLLGAGVPLPPYAVVAARHQTAGRGRYGRQWIDRAGENALFSFWYKPRVKYDQSFVLYQTAAVAVTEVLHAHGIPAVIKFPNDILVEGKKIGGILIENQARGQSIVRSVTGIGLNINQIHFPEGLEATSIRKITGQTSPVEEWIIQIVEKHRQTAAMQPDEISARYLYYWQYAGPKNTVRLDGGRSVRAKVFRWSGQKLYISTSNHDAFVEVDPRTIHFEQAHA